MASGKATVYRSIKAWLKNPDGAFALRGKRIAIIAHGGSVLRDNPNAERAYTDLLLQPLSDSLTSFGFDVVGLDGDRVKGQTFGVEGYKDVADAVFPDMIHNWSEVKNTISPLVNQLIQI